jgi:hypothetical protein
LKQLLIFTRLHGATSQKTAVLNSGFAFGFICLPNFVSDPNVSVYQKQGAKKDIWA